MSDNRTHIVRARSEYLEVLKTRFPDRDKAYDWCGPGLRFPFTDETFLEDTQWERMPGYSLVNESKEEEGKRNDRG